MTYQVTVGRHARKSLSKLDKQISHRIAPLLLELAKDPRPPGAKKLVGTENLWRIRAGDYRIVYEIEDDVLRVLVILIGHRRDVYRDL